MVVDPVGARPDPGPLGVVAARATSPAGGWSAATGAAGLAEQPGGPDGRMAGERQLRGRREDPDRARRPGRRRRRSRRSRAARRPPAAAPAGSRRRRGRRRAGCRRGRRARRRPGGRGASVIASPPRWSPARVARSSATAWRAMIVIASVISPIAIIAIASSNGTQRVVELLGRVRRSAVAVAPGTGGEEHAGLVGDRVGQVEAAERPPARRPRRRSPRGARAARPSSADSPAGTPPSGISHEYASSV